MHGKKKAHGGTKRAKSPTPGPEEYVVESVVDKKVEGGISYYFIKWKDWSSDTNTWEPLSNLQGCLDLVNAYDKKQEEKSGKKEKSSSGQKRKKKTESDSDSVYDSDASDSGIRNGPPKDNTIDVDVLEECPEGKVPEELLGVVPITGIMTYLVKWKPKGDGDDAEAEDSEPDMCLVKGDVFKAAFPQTVIAFFEKHISWLRDTREDEERAEGAAEAVNGMEDRKIADDLQVKASAIQKSVDVDGEVEVDLSSSDSDSAVSATDDKYEIDPDTEND